MKKTFLPVFTAVIVLCNLFNISYQIKTAMEMRQFQIDAINGFHDFARQVTSNQKS